jgi:hypothetical protein
MTAFIKQYFYFLPTTMLLFSAIAKIFLFDPTKVDLPLPGMAELMMPLGALELVCTLLFVYPRSMKLGFLLICCFLGGAIAVNLVVQLHSPLMPGFILALFWVGVYLKRPELFF